MPVPRRPTPPPPETGRVAPGGAEAEAIADPRLLAAGWQCRFVAQGARGDEMVALYRGLGFEVLEVPLAPTQLDGECHDCRVVAVLQFRLIYTRRAGRPPADTGG